MHRDDAWRADAISRDCRSLGACHVRRIQRHSANICEPLLMITWGGVNALVAWNSRNECMNNACYWMDHNHLMHIKLIISISSLHFIYLKHDKHPESRDYLALPSPSKPCLCWSQGQSFQKSQGQCGNCMELKMPAANRECFAKVCSNTVGIGPAQVPGRILHTSDLKQVTTVRSVVVIVGMVGGL